MAASAAVALVVVILAVVISLLGGNQEQQPETSGPAVPEGMVLVNDIYEGERLVPDFDMPLNEYSPEDFVEEKRPDPLYRRRSGGRGGRL